MEQFFKKPRTQMGRREDPLGTYLDSFVEQLTNQGYSRSTISYRLRLAADFNRWLKHLKIPLKDIALEHIDSYLKYRAQQYRIRKDDATALRYLLTLPDLTGVITILTAPAAPTQAELLAEEFRSYLLQERALAHVTATHYMKFIRHFLKDRFADREVTLSVLCAADIVGYIER